MKNNNRNKCLSFPVTSYSPTAAPLLSLGDIFNPFTHKSDLINFTLSNVDQFYLSKKTPWE